MSKWLDYADLPAGTLVDADILPAADMSATVGERQRIVTIESLRTVLAGAIPLGTDPTVDTDETLGYRAGSIVINTSDGGLFKCVDASEGAADWDEFGAGVGDVVGPASTVDDRIATFDGTTGKLIQDGGYTIAGLGAVPVTINTQAGTTYTFALGDEEDVNTFDNAAAIAVTIPTNAAVAFAVGTVLVCGQKGAGLVTCTGDTGVTVNGASAGDVDSAGQWSTWTLTKIATDSWWASGGLA